MRSRTKILGVSAIVVIALAVVVALTREHEPTYQGRSLSQWVEPAERTRSATAYPLNLPAGAEEAIRHMGTNAVPMLLRWIKYERPPLKVKFAPQINKLPSRLAWRLVYQDLYRAGIAEAAFGVLGPDAQPAIPELTRLAAQAPMKNNPHRAMRALGNLGPAGLPALLELATSTNLASETRTYAIMLIPNLRTNALPAVPILISLLDRENTPECDAAMSALGALALSRESVIPALISNLQHTNPSHRVNAAYSLRGFGAHARSAIPQLQAVLLDTNLHARYAATNALLRIAPEALTNRIAP